MVAPAPRFEMLEVEAFVQLIPEQILAKRVIERAVRDVLETCELPELDIQRTRCWLFSRKTDPLTAEWWAEQFDVGYFLEKCRKLVRERLHGRVREEVVFRDRSGSLRGVGYRPGGSRTCDL